MKQIHLFFAAKIYIFIYTTRNEAKNHVIHIKK